MASQVDPKRGLEGALYEDIVCEGICGLLSSSRRYCNITVWISSPFCLFFQKFYHFWAVMMSSGNLVCQPCAGLTSCPK